MSRYNHNISQGYVGYNDRYDIKALDMNVWDATDATIADGASGRHLYKNEPRSTSQYLCDDGRDVDTNYILGVDRDDHPDHTSRFSFGHCPNGYCTGNWPGRYATSLVCNKNIMPPGMAPARFYSEEMSGPFVVKSQGIVDYNSMKPR